MYPHAYQAAASPADVSAAREKIAALILRALGKDVPTGSSNGSPNVAASGIGFGGGCSTSGAQSALFGLALALVVLGRRKYRA